MVLIVGGVITVAFTLLFGMETPWPHMLALAALTVIVSLILYTVATLESIPSTVACGCSRTYSSWCCAGSRDN